MCLLKRHLAFLLPFIAFHALSFSTEDSARNLLKTNTFIELSFVLSSGILLCVPFVLPLLSSSLVKKLERSWSAHLWRLVSLCKIFLTTNIFQGVTQEPISLSPTWMSATTSWRLGWGTFGVEDTVDGTVGVAGGSGARSSKSLFRLAKATESIVGRSLSWGSIRSKLNLGSCNRKEGKIYLSFPDQCLIRGD